MQCANGHEASPGHRYCGVCGAAVATEPPTTPSAPQSSAHQSFGQLATTPVPATQQPQKQKPTTQQVWILVGIGVIIAVVTLAFTLHRTPKHDVSGTFTLYDSTSTYSSCLGQGGYADIGPGTDVSIRDQNNDLIGKSSLGAGAPSEGACEYSFTVAAVPANMKFYSIEVSHRGALTYSLADMKSMDWTVDMTLGQE
jgi:hypothetical protein